MVSDIDIMAEDEKRKKRKLLFRKLAISCTITLALLLVGLFVFVRVLIIPSIELFGEIFDSPLCDPSNPEGIQSVAQIELPPSYSNLWSTCGGLQDGGQRPVLTLTLTNLIFFSKLQMSKK